MRSAISPRHLAHFSSVVWRFRGGRVARCCISRHPPRVLVDPAEDGYLVADVTRGASVFLVVALAGQQPVARPAGEAVGVVLLPHRLHRGLPRPHRFVAEGADVCGKK